MFWLAAHLSSKREDEGGCSDRDVIEKRSNTLSEEKGEGVSPAFLQEDLLGREEGCGILKREERRLLQAASYEGSRSSQRGVRTSPHVSIV